jgi:hypothetical protein
LPASKASLCTRRAAIVIAAMRFVHIQLLDDQEIHSAGGVRVESVLSASLAGIVAGPGAHLVLG